MGLEQSLSSICQEKRNALISSQSARHTPVQQAPGWVSQNVGCSGEGSGKRQG